ncbi:MAG: tetratricopeptide repeat protein [Bradymonadaceae bacterium]
MARLIGDSERRADVLVRAARIGERAGRPPARLARLVERSLEASPNGPGRHRLAGRLWHRAGRLDPAIRHYRSAWRANLGDVELGRQLAALLRERGDRRDAIEIYRRLYRQNPEHPQIGLNLAKLEAASGRAARAEGVYLQLLEHHPEHPSILLRYARFLQRQGRTDRAEEIEHRAREKMPGVDRREMRRLE